MTIQPGERTPTELADEAQHMYDAVSPGPLSFEERVEARTRFTAALRELRQRAEQRDRMREALERILGYAENNDEQRINDRFDAIHRIARAALAGLSQPGKDEA